MADLVGGGCHGGSLVVHYEEVFSPDVVVI